MLSAPVACLSFGLFVDWKRTLRVSACAVALVVAGGWVLNSATHGGFLTNIVGYNVNPFSWKTAGILIYSHLRDCWPRVAIAVAAVAGGWKLVKAGSLNRYARAVVLAGLNAAFALIATVSIGKMGAIYNHFLAWDVSICLLGGLFLFRMPVRVNAGRATTVACGVFLVGLLLPATGLVSGVRRTRANDAVPGEAEIMRMIRQTAGPVYSENLLLLIEAGKPVEVEPATFTFLALSGGWDERPYVQLFGRQYFRLLVVNDLHFEDRYTPAVAAAVERGYVREQQIGDYSIYRPVR